jgi:hypothetical protein
MILIEPADSTPPTPPLGITLRNKSAREILEDSIKAPVSISSALLGKGVVQSCHFVDGERTGIA